MSGVSNPYNPQHIELERQSDWESANIFKVEEDPLKDKHFIVDMFPYPSGSGIHVGHVKNYVATDVQARVMQRQGINVLHPMGYDSFGLPAENYALSRGEHPKISVERNVRRFGEQLRRLGLGYDWSREINTVDNDFIKWTQEGFLTLFEQGLVSEEEAPINWCNSCTTGLSNEDLEENGCCERCGSEVERKMMRQWSVHITEYADELIDNMSELSEWEPFLLDIQRNWIGRQEGWNTRSDLVHRNGNRTDIDIFSADIQRLNGASFIALSPERAKTLGILEILEPGEVKDAVESYITKNIYKRDRDRRVNQGIKIDGLQVINPLTGDELPVYISEYVLPKSDDGAIFGNTHISKKDKQFADTFQIEEGVFNNQLDEARIIETLSVKDKISKKNIYRLEDWVFSRQRFWGEPIPIVHCDSCGSVPVPRSNLPVLLPDVEKYEQTNNGESPLSNIESWVNTDCPCCKGPAKRETNTMPQWAGSSWYWHRYKDPHNQTAMVGKVQDKYWGQVDTYVGGAEHAARHLIYARFWNFVLNKAGVVMHKEPFKKVQHIGLVMDENGVKISKRLGNGVNIDEVVERYGADALRLGVMQMGEFSQQTNWNNSEIAGAKRFIDKIWALQYKINWKDTSEPYQDDIVKALNQAIQKVTDDIGKFKFNTAIAAIRTLLNTLEKDGRVPSRREYETLLSLLQPFTPHITEEIIRKNAQEDVYLHQVKWPELIKSDETINATREVVLTRNGKKIGVIALSTAIVDENEIINALSSLPNQTIQELLQNEQLKRIVAPVGKNIINFVV